MQTTVSNGTRLQAGSYPRKNPIAFGGGSSRERESVQDETVRGTNSILLWVVIERVISEMYCPHGIRSTRIASVVRAATHLSGPLRDTGRLRDVH